MTILSNTEHGVFRLGAIQTLGVLKDPRATTLLTEQLDDSSVQVRRIATEALGEIGDRGAIAPLLKMLNDQSAEVRWAAADAHGINRRCVCGRYSHLDYRKKDGYGRGEWCGCWTAWIPTGGKREATLRIETYFLEHIDHPRARSTMALCRSSGRNCHCRGRARNSCKPWEQKRTLIIAAAHAFFIRNGISEAEPLPHPGPASVRHRGNGPDISKCRPPRSGQSPHTSGRAGRE